jgi:hypothetical protein
MRYWAGQSARQSPAISNRKSAAANARTLRRSPKTTINSTPAQIKDRLCRNRR